MHACTAVSSRIFSVFVFDCPLSVLFTCHVFFPFANYTSRTFRSERAIASTHTAQDGAISSAQVTRHYQIAHFTKIMTPATTIALNLFFSEVPHFKG